VSSRDLAQGEHPTQGATFDKGLDTFSPCGPYLTLAADVHDPQNLAISATLDGKPASMPNPNTRFMTFKIPQIISYVSRRMTLEVGDIFQTGVPAPVVPLKAGDRIEITIEGLARCATASLPTARRPVVSCRLLHRDGLHGRVVQPTACLVAVPANDDAGLAHLGGERDLDPLLVAPGHLELGAAGGHHQQHRAGARSDVDVGMAGGDAHPSGGGGGRLGLTGGTLAGTGAALADRRHSPGKGQRRRQAGDTGREACSGRADYRAAARIHTRQ
jgi:hypothetical protein